MRIHPIISGYNASKINYNLKNANMYAKNSSSIAFRDDIKKPTAFFDIPFTSLLRNGKQDFKVPNSTFFRDLPTLSYVAKGLQDTFSEGALVLDYACSDGEEAISLLALLGDERSKYKIRGIDSDKEMVEFAKRGNYSILLDLPDAFLLDNRKSKDEETEYAKEQFHKIMKTTNAPECPSSNTALYNSLKSLKPESEHYFELKDEYKEQLSFELGDIKDLNKLKTEGKVGAIFFRNATYHVFNSNEGAEILKGLSKPKANISVEDKQKLAEDIVAKIDKKLAPNGYFVIGTSANETLFLADKNTPGCEITQLKYKENFEKGNPKGQQRILKESPMEKALIKSGKFRPVASSMCVHKYGSFSVPTVWQKII